MPNVPDITVERLQNGNYRLSCQSNNNWTPLYILAGNTPDAIDRSVAFEGDLHDGRLTLTGLNPDHHYFFKIVLNENIAVIAADRKVHLEGADNFRDLGGYRTPNGLRTRWGQIFRSDHLAELTSTDQAVLGQLGIRCVCDFRSVQEISIKPDRLPRDIAAVYSHMPIVNKMTEPSQAVARILKGDISWFTRDFVIRSYLQLVDDFADVWREFFICLFNKANRPLVFHCTGGKDRTGVCAALILLVLGVPTKTVIEDYALSNVYKARFFEKVRRRIAKTGIDPDDIHDYIFAPTKAIIAAIAHLEEKFGSASNYLIQKAGIQETQLEKFRQEMLESNGN